MHTTQADQTDLEPQKRPSHRRQSQNGAVQRTPIYAPIIKHRIQRADWMTAQVSNLLIACGRFLGNDKTNKIQLS